jgi:hypothetical protein
MNINNYVYKVKDICAKVAEWTRSRVSNRSRGFSARSARHMEKSKDYQQGQGSISKPVGPHPLPLLDLAAGAGDGPGGQRCRCSGNLGSRVNREIEREGRGELVDVLTGVGGRRWRAESGRRRSATGRLGSGELQAALHNRARAEAAQQLGRARSRAPPFIEHGS